MGREGEKDIADKEFEKLEEFLQCFQRAILCDLGYATEFDCVLGFFFNLKNESLTLAPYHDK